MPQRFAQRALVCLIVTMAVVTVHELMHIAIGHALGMGAHFTNLTAADVDPLRARSATAAARALMAGAAPLFTVTTGVAALLAAPWARRRQHELLARVLGWIAIFGIPYVGIQLMTLGGPARGVDTAAVLVDYFGVGGILRSVIAVAGVAFTIAAGYLLGRALGDQVPAPSNASGASPDVSTVRRRIGFAFAVSSVCLVGLGARLMAHPGHGNPMGAFLLAIVLWPAGMMTMTPWRRPGPRFVRDEWLAPAVAAMSILTIVGATLPSDYTAAGLFFLPQLATATYAARNKVFYIDGCDAEPLISNITAPVEATQSLSSW